jgi:23S rRNA (adenine2503-C2)-methyltransferase
MLPVAHVNLIQYNPWPGAPYEGMSVEGVRAFRDALESKGVSVSVRRSRGGDVLGACGQLRASALLKPSAPNKHLVSGIIS